MIHTIENGKVRATVSTKGAELQSLYSKETEREYMWQAAPETWPSHSLLLFPACGRVANSRMLVKGKEYPLMMHGFAKDSEFETVEKTATSVTLMLRDNDDTRRVFPYDFRFVVKFYVEGDTVYQNFNVINDGKGTMYFSLGAHPGFFCPIVLGERPENYVMRFDCPQNIKEFVKDPATWLLTHERTTFLDGTDVPLSDSFFDNGPMVLENVHANSVTLLSKESGRFVEMGIKDFPFMCLWGKGGRMQIICIEPWCGTSDFVDADFEWEHRYGNESVEAGKTFERQLYFKLG